MDELELQVEIQNDDEGQQEVSCGSKLMIGVIGELGNAIYSNYCSIGVVNMEILYLVVNNAGGHEINESMLKYGEYLEAKYNTMVHHQVPWYHETNTIDLGAWITVKSKVE